jgi:multiple sugar transport system permease protein
VNSIIIALTSTLLSVMLGALAGYALARFKFMGKGVIEMSTLLLRMIAPVVLVIPIYILWSKFGLVNTRMGLSLTYVALNLSFNIWVLRTFISEIPIELEEAALIDGCSEITIFFRIILPLIAPGIAVASIFTFRIAWNEFILSLVLTNRYTRTLPVAVSLYLTDHGIEWGQITAIATIIAIPAFIFTFTAAKSLIMGLTAGAVKG